MAETKIVTVTNEGLQKMKEELEYLKNVKRKEIVESIGIAGPSETCRRTVNMMRQKMNRQK